MQRGARDHRGRGGLLARLSLGIGIAGGAIGLFDCSLILDWRDYTPASNGTDWDGEASTGAGIDSSSASDAGVGSDTLPDGPRAARCVSSAPPGWSGPLALYLGDSGTPVPACGSDYATKVFDGFEGLNAPPASCSCAPCGTPQGSSCTPPNLIAYSDLGCGMPCADPVPLLVESCTASPQCTRSFKVSGATLDAGTCAPSTVSVTTQQLTWSRLARACAAAVSPTSGSCKTNEVLAPAPGPSFEPRLCIMSAGEVSCPTSSEYVRSYTVYADKGVQDSRGCSPCSCEPPTGGSCSFPRMSGAPLAAYSESMCTQPFIQGLPIFTIPTSPCVPPVGLQTPPYFKLIQSAGLDPGSCAPGGGQPTGTVTAAAGSSMTMCCTLL